MRRTFLAFALAPAALTACNSSGSNASPDASDASSATDTITDAVFTVSDAEPQPDTQTCSGDPAGCLSGTAQVQPSDDGGVGFPAEPTRIRARLFRTYPSSGVNSIAEQIVARDSTWAFSGLASWGHYYVQFEPGFPAKAAVTRTVATRVGPLAIPTASASPIAVQVKPVQLDVFEASSPTMAGTVEAASARIAEATDGTSNVSILVGTASTPMPYDATTHAYSVTFPTPPAAQPAYTIVTSSGSASATWNLVASPPTFTGTIASPAPGATLRAGDPIPVTWSPEPADYVVVELFVRTQGRWVSVYMSAQPDASDVSSETIPARLQDGGLETPAGSYLLNVSFTSANCPATADGCVHASTVANEQLTVN